MWHRAMPLCWSTSRKLVQPLVAQYGRAELLARRRRRRIADARPVTDEVVDRDIMIGSYVLSGAPSSRDGRSAARPVSSWRLCARDVVLWCLRAGPGAFSARTGSSRRTGY